MEQTLLNSIYAQWLVVKAEAARECENRSLTNLAEAYSNCAMFKGNETLEQLLSLFKSPQGLEFCMRYRFPSLAVIRAFKRDGTERYGIYIDAGSLTLTEPKSKVLLIGHTTAVINCAKLKRYEVVCLYGAKAVINASGWAVVRAIADNKQGIVKNISGSAVVL